MIELAEVAERRSFDGVDVRLNAWDFGGQGPVMLMHHANGLAAALWAPVALSMLQHYRVIALDARGHGDSDNIQVPQQLNWRLMVEDAVRVLEQVCQLCQVDHVAHGVGSSFGGIILAAASAEQPDRLRRVTMLDPPIHPDPETVARLGMEMPDHEFSRDTLVAQTLKRKSVWASRQQAHDAWRSKPLFAPWQDDAFDLYIAEGLGEREDGQVELKCNPEVEAHIFATTGSLGVMEYAPKVQVPVTLVHARDGYFPEVFFRALAKVFPHGEFLQMAGGHMLPMECPEDVIALLKSLPS